MLNSEKMKKFLLSLCSILLVGLFLFPQKVGAIDTCEQFSMSPSPLKASEDFVEFTVGPVKGERLDESRRYEIRVDLHASVTGACRDVRSGFLTPKPGSSTISHKFAKDAGLLNTCNPHLFFPNYRRSVFLWAEGADGARCVAPSIYRAVSDCKLTLVTTKLDINSPVTIKGEKLPNIRENGGMLQITARGFRRDVHDINISADDLSFEVTTGPLPSTGAYQVELRGYQLSWLLRQDDILGSTTEPTHCPALPFGVGTEEQPVDNTPGGDGPTGPITFFGLEYCDTNKTQLRTAVGCIPFTGANEFVKWFLGWAIGIASGIAFLLIIFAGFKIMTASGNPEKLQDGRELLIAAISGLILIVFSVFLLKLIGVTIFQIPGF